MKPLPFPFFSFKIPFCPKESEIRSGLLLNFAFLLLPFLLFRGFSFCQRVIEHKTFLFRVKRKENEPTTRVRHETNSLHKL